MSRFISASKLSACSLLSGVKVDKMPCLCNQSWMATSFCSNCMSFVSLFCAWNAFVNTNILAANIPSHRLYWVMSRIWIRNAAQCAAVCVAVCAAVFVDVRVVVFVAVRGWDLLHMCRGHATNLSMSIMKHAETVALRERDRLYYIIVKTDLWSEITLSTLGKVECRQMVLAPAWVCLYVRMYARARMRVSACACVFDIYICRCLYICINAYM